MFKKAHLVVLGLTLFSFSAIADNPVDGDGRSKENKTFEAENTFSIPGLPNIWKVIKTITPKDGRVRIGYENLTGFSNSGNERSNYTVSMETYLGGKHRDNENDVNFAILPLEYRFAIDTKGNNIDLQNLKVGVVRVLFEKAPVTIQAASFVIKQNPNLFGRFYGGEVAKVTFKPVGTFKSNKKVEIVIKADLAFQAGKTVTDSNVMNAAIADAGLTPNDAILNDKQTTIRVPMSLSIGARLYKKALVEAYAGFNPNVAFDDHHEGGSYRPETIGELYRSNSARINSDMHHFYTGAGLRLEWKSLVLSGSLQRDWFYNTFHFQRTNRIKERTTNYSASDDNLVDWQQWKGKHTNDDRGYTGMVNVGVDW